MSTAKQTETIRLQCELSEDTHRQDQTSNQSKDLKLRGLPILGPEF